MKPHLYTHDSKRAQGSSSTEGIRATYIERGSLFESRVRSQTLFQTCDLPARGKTLKQYEVVARHRRLARFTWARKVFSPAGGLPPRAVSPVLNRNRKTAAFHA